MVDEIGSGRHFGNAHARRRPTDQPLMARTTKIHAMMSEENATERLKTNMASTSMASSAFTVSEFEALKYVTPVTSEMGNVP